MSTYIDPATAITIARRARAEQLRRAEHHRQTRLAEGHDVRTDGLPTAGRFRRCPEPEPDALS